jgi:hypothetical protein
MLRLIVRRTSKISQVLDGLGLKAAVSQPKTTNAKVKVNLTDLQTLKPASHPDIYTIGQMIQQHVSTFGALPNLPKEAQDLAPLREENAKFDEEVTAFSDEFYNFRLNVGCKVLTDTESDSDSEVLSYPVANLFKKDSDDEEEEPRYPHIAPEEHAALDQIIAPINPENYKVCSEETYRDPDKYAEFLAKTALPPLEDRRTVEFEADDEGNQGPISSGQAQLGIGPSTYNSYLTRANGEDLDPNDEEVMKDSNQTSYYQMGFNDNSDDEYPDFPENLHPKIEEAVKEVVKWEAFACPPTAQKYLKLLGKVMKEPHQPWQAVQLPSVLNYYETLPKWYKDQRLVWAAVGLMDKYHPDIPRKKKETMLNLLCFLLTPKNPKKYLFLQEYYSPKYTLEQAAEAKENERLLKGSMAQETFEEIDNKKEFAEVQELTEAQITIKRLIGEDLTSKSSFSAKIDVLPDFGVDWFTQANENAKGPIPCPFTYYDNDDGYWDDWIKTKRERIGMPELSRRANFRH